LPDHPAAKLCRPGTMPAGPVPGAPCGWIRCSRNQCPAGTSARLHRPRSAPGRTRPASISSRNEKARVNGLRRPPWLFFCPRPAPISTAAAPISTGKDRAAHGDGLPDLPGLGGVGLPDEQRTARPITCPACSFQPDPAAALMTPPPCCPHPCQTYRQRQPPARQHPAASPTPEGSDSPPNGIWL
jgi:hypothetical protein